MSAKYFLTGATGFLGTKIAEELSGHADVTLYALVRAKTDEEARLRLEKLWWTKSTLREGLGKWIIPLAGDITQELLGLPPERYRSLSHEIDYIIHSAAEVGITTAKDRLQKVNVEGTQTVLDFAVQVNNHHPFARFSHVSTAYVAGSRQGMMYENELIDQGFESLYEQSKYEAELLVQACSALFPITIFRPSQIVGDSQTGEISTFNTLYYPLKLYLKKQLKFLPISPFQKVNLVPVDYVAQEIVELTDTVDAAGLTFHLTIPFDQQPTVKELLLAVRAWAQENLNVTLPQPVFLPIPLLGKLGRKYNLDEEDKGSKKTKMRNIISLAPYFFEKRIFDIKSVLDLSGDKHFDWRALVNPLLSYAVSKGFLNHNERTVFEQMKMRMEHTNNAITYHNVSSGQCDDISAANVHAQVLQARNALQAMGIKRGSRVALAGTNSTNYLVLDMAIGLLGATSVPLYYTSPLEEVAMLVKKSKAELLFLGTPKLIDQAGQLDLDIPLISFLMEPARSLQAQGLLSWDAFLLQGEASANADDTTFEQEGFLGLTEPQQDLSYGDIGTIRYTSGTTGQPKGVLFSQYQLRWMAETLPTLLDWKTRTSKIRYLSFLPMSHVVEGILVAYAPYYILADIDLYYLTEFDQLSASLPKIRPTIFFSVPRFYEKVWDQFVATGFATYYLSLKESGWKKSLRKVARYTLLRKAGLDKCNQLLVGSAPISIQLLESFRELGIEIYNAYGLTEAPLITLSRLGENELGSVGGLLPETEARIDDTGEIFVRGPQVTFGYDGNQHSAVDEEGFFATGDFGSFSKEGHLVIGGRKKDLLITSYGKNINPQKIETRLKAIPLVSEVLVVGEGLPYCSALIWLDSEAISQDDIAKTDEAIRTMNESLSHPEQIKSWVLLKNTLSIAAGELTPNLKLRRNRIIEIHQDIITSLYSNDLIRDERVIHRGTAQ